MLACHVHTREGCVFVYLPLTLQELPALSVSLTLRTLFSTKMCVSLCFTSLKSFLLLNILAIIKPLANVSPLKKRSNHAFAVSRSHVNRGQSH